MKHSDNTGFTLTEILVTMAVIGFVAAAASASFITLQRGFVYLSTWSDAKANQVRMMDALAIDLRAASSIVSSSAKGAPFALTLKVPRRYSAYETTGFRAGDPVRPTNVQSPEPLLDGSCSAATRFDVVYPDPSGLVTVVYQTRDRSSSSGNTKVVYRKLENSEREIASFPGNVDIYLEDAVGSNTPVTSSKAVVITISTATDNRFANRSANVTSTLSKAVFLRQMAFQ